MEVAQAKTDVKDVVSNLLSHDPVVFNSTINAHFASGCTYAGHGLRIHGASNLKHAAFLFNLLDAGSAAKIDDSDIRWDEASSTARVKATRFLRPRLFPLFQFAVPTEVTLTFNPSSTDADAKSEKSQLLYCTSFEDKWPLDSLIRSLPIIAFFYTHFFTPLATIFVLQLSNFVFALHARLGSWDRRMVEPTVKTYQDSVDPRLPKGLKDGFERGMNLAEGLGGHAISLVTTLSHGPLRAIETVAQTSTSLANAVLPGALQLPYPSVFGDDAATSSGKLSSKSKNREGLVLFSDSNPARRMSNSQMPEIRLSPSDEQPPSYRSVESSSEEGEGAKGKSKSKSSGSGSGKSKSKSKSTSASPSGSGSSSGSGKSKSKSKSTSASPSGSGSSSGSSKPDKKAATVEDDNGENDEGTQKHAKVVVGDANSGEGAKEIDVVTHEVTETGGDKDQGGASLYSQLKKDGELEESLLSAEHAADGAGSDTTSAQSSPKLDQDDGGAAPAKTSSSSSGAGGSKKKKKSKSSKTKK
ncbi:uncharacterized protein PFL1_03545 [Pseudozyma flocculosa PF-1]|uniref:Uncharacterized protein n=2 Tax=Pseudozyma flocculosa TaxID=84751 RepID=A0A5C3F667_9BASI|nr:uncharacterized protein PFL1_03545 [Pseudozyma flocculosa PF-1]EPQ28742.1 hypothetical protein PFL1_03545 [Pseudozyma flocculosa PF-1]SPO39486.1 uncharacterized protein PSFLO_04967 [Pseudozyma flocculosa]